MRRDGFDAFCAAVLRRPTFPGDISPSQLAEEFVRHFRLTGFPRMARLVELIRKERVGDVAPMDLPDDMRGAHAGFRPEPYRVYYDSKDWSGAWEHTVLHEIYEIIQEKFRDMCPAYALPRKDVLDRRADRFAAEVLMQPALFDAFLRGSGLDLALAARSYGRSYSSVAIRLAEVMKEQPLLAAVYARSEHGEPEEWTEPDQPEDFVATTVACTAGFRAATPRLAGQPSSCASVEVFRRGEPPQPGSAVALAIRWGEAVYVERLAGHDSVEGAMDLVALARPLMRLGRVARVILLALPWKDRALLEPQVMRVSPRRAERACQTT